MGRGRHNALAFHQLRQRHAARGPSALLRARSGRRRPDGVRTAAQFSLTPTQRVALEKERIHMFCENRKAGLFSGQRLGEHVAEQGHGHILRVWSVESSEMTERHKCEHCGQLRRVVHLAQGAYVMLVLNLRTSWNLVNGLRGAVVAVLLESQQTASVSSPGVSAGGACRRDSASEPGGLSARQVEYIRVDFPGYIGPEMVPGQPTWVLLQKETIRHEQCPALSRTQFPIVLAYGITVRKSQGLTLLDGCVFNADHEPTWSPLKCLGLAFVGMSRATHFARMAFKYVPDYWAFRAVADTDLFRWRAALEKRLDALHDATARGIFGGAVSVEDDLARHVAWSESRQQAAAQVKGLRKMLSLRGMLSAPRYDERPTKLPASKLGGGRKRRKTVRAMFAAEYTADPEEGRQAYKDEEDLVQKYGGLSMPDELPYSEPEFFGEKFLEEQCSDCDYE